MPNSSHSPGGTGKLFPDATLSTRDGSTITLDVFRPKWDLVMVMAGANGLSPQLVRLLDGLALARADIEAEDGKVLVVTAADWSMSWRWPFPLLLDEHGRLHQRVGAVDGRRRIGNAYHHVSDVAAPRSSRTCGITSRP